MAVVGVVTMMVVGAVTHYLVRWLQGGCWGGWRKVRVVK